MYVANSDTLFRIDSTNFTRNVACFGGALFIRDCFRVYVGNRSSDDRVLFSKYFALYGGALHLDSDNGELEDYLVSVSSSDLSVQSFSVPSDPEQCLQTQPCSSSCEHVQKGGYTVSDVASFSEQVESQRHTRFVEWQRFASQQRRCLFRLPQELATRCQCQCPVQKCQRLSKFGNRWRSDLLGPNVLSLTFSAQEQDTLIILE